jgi:hypothetical protein
MPGTAGDLDYRGPDYRWANVLAKLYRDYYARDHVLTAEEIKTCSYFRLYPRHMSQFTDCLRLPPVILTMTGSPKSIERTVAGPELSDYTGSGLSVPDYRGSL